MLKKSLYSDVYSGSDDIGDNTSDKLIWSSFKEGSRTSFEYIYNQNFERLLNYGLKITPDQYLVEDQIQDLFIYLWKKKEGLDIKISIPVYLIWSLRNRMLKSLKVQKNIELNNEIDIPNENDSLEQMEKIAQLNNAVDKLPLKQREVIYLKYFQNLDGEEISKIMGITLGSTYNIMSRAIAKLRENIPALLIATEIFDGFI